MNEKFGKSFQAKTVAEAKAKISSQSNLPLTFAVIVEALDILRGAISIVYPMGLPEYDPIRMEFENREELAGQFFCPLQLRVKFHLVEFLRTLIDTFPFFAPWE